MNLFFSNFLLFSRLGLKCLKNYPYYFFYKQVKRGQAVAPGIARNFFYSKAIIDFSKATSKYNLLTTCNLDSDSLVFDVGGYNGDWANSIYKKYSPYIHIFEPLPSVSETLKKKFFENEKILIHYYGLADKNTNALFNAAEMGSSVYSIPMLGMLKKIKKISVELRDIFEVMQTFEVKDVDLIKINIEGGEYSLLMRMIEAGIIKHFNVIRVQFHEWIPGAHKMRRQIRANLAETHEIEWEYPFVWESWRLRIH